MLRMFRMADFYQSKSIDVQKKKHISDEVIAELEEIKLKFKEEEINDKAEAINCAEEKYADKAEEVTCEDKAEEVAKSPQQEEKNSDEEEKTAEKHEENSEDNSSDIGKKGGCIKEVLFYVFLIGMVAAVFVFKGNGAPRSFMGYSAFTVLSGSMGSDIPKGSLVVTKHVSARELQIGDDITYMINPTTTITHRIVGIIENYSETGERAFRTKGVVNSTADKLPVPAVNVVGKVIFHNYFLGQGAKFIVDYWYLIILFFVLTGGFYILIKMIFLKPEKKE